MQQSSSSYSENTRLRFIGVFLILVGVMFSVRLFYLQIIKGSDYRQAADLSQTKQLEIVAKRGKIFAFNGDNQVPLVLNERQWLMFADSQFSGSVNELEDSVKELGIVLNEDQKARIEGGSRYVILSTLVNDKTKQSVEENGVKGIYFQEKSIRAYTEGGLAAQILGFVNNDGLGQYGVEERYASSLEGVNGKLKAVTDSNGVPLAFEEDNISIAPENGQDITLTVDVGVQQIAEQALKNGVDKTSALGGSVVILDADTGAVKALANYPSYEPANYSKVEDIRDYTNKAISEVIEPGSITKVLVMASALDQGVVDLNYSYFDNDQVTLDGETVKNALDYGAQTRRLEDILTNSLNTGSIHLLSLLGDGTVNERARTTLYDYYTNKFGLGAKTGIDLNNEASGRVFGPSEGFGLNIRYGNMTFGQGISVTPLQMAAAYASIFNGGNQITPYVVDSIGENKTEPVIKQSGILSQSAIDNLRELMRRMAARNYADVQFEGFEISGKTGTAQIPTPDGGYLEGKFTGTFTGYIKSKDKTLVIVVRIDQPQVQYASLQGSAPIWKEIVKNLVSSGKTN